MAALTRWRSWSCTARGSSSSRAAAAPEGRRGDRPHRALAQAWLAGQRTPTDLVGCVVLADVAYGLPQPGGARLIAGPPRRSPMSGPSSAASPPCRRPHPGGHSGTVDDGAFSVSHALEGRSRAPPIQRGRDDPAGAALIALVVAGTPFGWIGIVFATPLPSSASWRREGALCARHPEAADADARRGAGIEPELTDAAATSRRSSA